MRVKWFWIIVTPGWKIMNSKFRSYLIKHTYVDVECTCQENRIYINNGHMLSSLWCAAQMGHFWGPQSPYIWIHFWRNVLKIGSFILSSSLQLGFKQRISSGEVLGPYRWVSTGDTFLRHWDCLVLSSPLEHSIAIPSMGVSNLHFVRWGPGRIWAQSG